MQFLASFPVFQILYFKVPFCRFINMKREETAMECSMCGDVGFQIYLFQCSKCLHRFQHQYCSRAYFESMIQLCDWCFTKQNEFDTRSHIINSVKSVRNSAEFDIRNSVKSVRNSAGFEKCTTITRNSNGKRNLRKSCVQIDGQKTNLLEKKKRSLLGDNMDRKVKKRYKLLHEILC